MNNNKTVSISEFLRWCSSSMDVNALGLDWEGEFRDALVPRPTMSEFALSVRRRFKFGMALTLLGDGATLREFTDATNWDFETEVEMLAELRRLWSIFYGDERPEEVVKQLGEEGESG